MINYTAKIKGPIKIIEFSNLEIATQNSEPQKYRNFDWMTLGPFVYETNGAFETEYLYEREKILEIDYLEQDGGEKEIAPYLGLKCKNKYLGLPEPVWSVGINKWDMLRFDADDADMACDDALYLTEQRNCVFYAAVYVNCNGPKEAVICYENSGGRLFHNGELISDEPYGRVKGLPTMGHAVPVKFSDGLNLLLFKLRPGYICDSVDLSMTNCSIYPICCSSGSLKISYPTVTNAFTKRDGVSHRLYPLFAAAFGKTNKGTIELDNGNVLEIPSLEDGETFLLRAPIAPGAGSCIVKVSQEGTEIAKGVFPLRPSSSPVFEGEEMVFSAFHFDTTYHQEQRVYAMGAIYILKNILQRMRENPEYKAIISEVDYLHPYYSIYPEDREFLKEVYTEGRAEADCFYNQPNEMTSSPEGIVRNLLYGQIYHRDVLGRMCYVYSPGDVFGHFNQISQVSAKGGCIGVSWDKHIFGLDSLFSHVSPDGSHLPHRRGGIGRGDAAQKGLSVCEGNANALSTVPGYPIDADTSWMNETTPHGKFATPKDYMEKILDDGARIYGEGNPPFELTSRDISLYHAGVSLTRTDFKQANRLAENLLITAEKLSVIASMYGAKYPEIALDKAWRQILCAQHHDSITGTNNEVSFVDLMVQYREACELAADITDKAAKYIAESIDTEGENSPIVFFNPHPWERIENNEFECELILNPEEYELVSFDGHKAELQLLSSELKGDHFTAKYLAHVAVPALGYRVYYLKEKESIVLPGGLDAGTVKVMHDDKNTISNDFFKIKVDPNKGGGIVSLYDRLNRKELIREAPEGPANALVALKETHDRMETQHEFYTTGHRLSSMDYKAEVKSEKSRLFERLIIKYSLGNVVRVTQTITLNTGSPRIDFETRLDDYREEDDLLALTFPVALNGAKPIFDDRFAPQVRASSKESLDFRTHQYAMFSHCAVYAANQWLDFGPTVTFKLSDANKNAAFNLGMTQCIRANNPEFEKSEQDLLFALTKKAVPVTPFPDRKQSCIGSKIIHFNEDLYSDTRIVLSIEGVENQYEEALLNSKSVKKDFENELNKNGYAVVFMQDEDNLWGKKVDVLLIKAVNVDILNRIIASIAEQLNVGRTVEINCILADMPIVPDDYGVALLNKGNIACSVEKGGTLCLMLYHTAEFYGNIGNANEGTPLVPERKSHIFHYSLLPHENSYREAEVYRRALELNDPIFNVKPEKTHKGAYLPTQKAFIKTGTGTIMTAMKARGCPMAAMSGVEKDIYDRGITLRFFEPHGLENMEMVELGFPIESYEKSNLLEESISESIFKENGNKEEIELIQGPHSIDTICLKPVPNQEIKFAILGPEQEPVEPIYIRSWEHDLGSMPMGFMSFAAVIGRNPKRIGPNTIKIEISAANNSSDKSASGILTLELPDGWSADLTKIDYQIEPGAYRVWNAIVTKPDENSKGLLRLLYEHNGQQFEDIFEEGLHDPEMQVQLNEDGISVFVQNNTAQTLRGELHIASPIETWGSMFGHNALGKAEFSPRVLPVIIKAGETCEYVFDYSGDVDLSFWAIVKLCMNGRIKFAGVKKYGERHTVWAHELIDELYADGGSLRKLLEM